MRIFQNQTINGLDHSLKINKIYTMDKERKATIGKAVKVGILVTVGCAIFVVAIFVLGRQQNLFGSTVTLKSVFPGVSGLQVGNNVRFNGINIGTVSEIILFNDTSVMVNMIVEKHVQKFIKQNSRCLIGSEGLMGDKVVTITAGSEDFDHVSNNTILKSEAPVEMDDIILSLKNTAENAEVISSELAVMMYKINNGNGVLSMLLTDSTMVNDLSVTLENLKSSSENLDENLEAAKKSFLLRGAIKKMEKEKKEKAEQKKNKK